MRNRNAQTLKHIIKHCDLINNDMQRFGLSFDIFCNNDAYHQSICFSMLKIGELINHFTDDFMAQIKESLPIAQIVGMRNVIVHRYLSIDLPTVWNTVINDIPDLRRFCVETLKTAQKQNDVENNPSPTMRP